MERVKYQSSKEKQSRGHGQSKMWKTFYNSCEDVTLLHIELSRTIRIAGFEQSFTRTVIYFFYVRIIMNTVIYWMKHSLSNPTKTSQIFQFFFLIDYQDMSASIILRFSSKQTSFTASLLTQKNI